jgi:hypothetical protein
LQEARDIIGECVMRSWSHFEPDSITFGAAAAALLQEADRGRARPYAGQFEECMKWREILW